MLQLFKNSVVTEAAQQQADVRQKELDFYTTNYWIWGGTCTVMAGWVFTQLTNPVPEGTNFYLEAAYLVSTATCLGLNLCIITWTTLLCVWGPGLALRGPHGMKSFHTAVDFLRDEQWQLYITFIVSVVAYFLSSCCIVWVYPSRTVVNSSCMGVMFCFLVIIMVLQLRLELRIGSGLWSHEVEGKITGFSPFEEVADLDTYMSSAVPAHMQATTMQPGLYSSTNATRQASSSAPRR